jgi:hypothetical protein
VTDAPDPARARRGRRLGLRLEQHPRSSSDWEPSTPRAVVQEPVFGLVGHPMRVGQREARVEMR